MPLVFGAIVPHPPVVIPAIGQSNLKQVKKTKKSLERLAEELYHAKPDTIIIISPHGQLLSDTFIINHSPVLLADFEDFGDVSTKLKFNNDLGLAYKIREALETKIPLVLTTDEKLDHGSFIPLYYLAENLRKVPIIPISYSSLDRQTHFKFGQEIRRVLEDNEKRVAVVASGDLAHCLTKKAPAKYSPQGKIFDQKLIELLKERNHQQILDLDKKLVDDASECGYRSILILLGIFDEINYEFKLLSYEGSLGVGYLVAQFIIK
ncbi:AmmeMemoRadiSam system protein B [Patescibacteria group bacterium]|nr:AmmeMemoRadiSam system protein B [Patescibacteria group bacterium]